MRIVHLLAIACVAACAPAFAQFEAFKGKMKEGLYEQKMEMDMGAVPGMPPGMGKQTFSMQHCVTQQDIDKGGFNKNREGKMPQNCEVKNMKVSGNTASYTMVCTGENAMTADNVINFLPDGYKMDMKMAMTRQGQTMNMNQKVEAKYLGPCKK